MREGGTYKFPGKGGDVFLQSLEGDERKQDGSNKVRGN